MKWWFFWYAPSHPRWRKGGINESLGLMELEEPWRCLGACTCTRWKITLVLPINMRMYLVRNVRFWSVITALGLGISSVSSVLLVSHVWSLQPHELHHARPPCPSPTPGVHSNSCPSSQWCHPAVSSSVIPFSSCPQSLPASESFPMSQLFTWGGQSTGVSALASFLPENNQGWSPSEWTGWISLQSKGLSRVFSNTTVQKHQFFSAQLSSQSNSHIHTWPLEKP